MGRPASGVIGVNLAQNDRVVSMAMMREGADLLVVTTKGFGKRTALVDYPTKGRATGGVITIKLRPNDEIASAAVVTDRSLLTFITSGGMVMRTTTEDISQLGRLTQGVTLISPNGNDRVAGLSTEELEESETDDGSTQMLISPDMA